jgi:hypothetical protein
VDTRHGSSGFSQKKLPDYAARTKRKKLEVRIMATMSIRARTRVRAKSYHNEALFSILHQNPMRKSIITGLLTDFWDWMRSKQC